MKRLLSAFLLCAGISPLVLPAIAAPVKIAQFRFDYDKYMQIGYAANARRDYKTALINFRKALKLRPGDKYASRAISNITQYAKALRSGQLYGFVPANRGTPNNRHSGGTRGCMNAGSEDLIALVPEKEALTTVDYPSLFFYMPQHSAPIVEFTLLDDRDREIYKTNITPNQKAGIARLDLSKLPNLPPLKSNQKYHWFLSLVCQLEDRSGDKFVEGSIEKIAIDPFLTSELKTANPRDRASLYASNGIWYDALAALYQARQSNPQDPALVKGWADLLKSVGLNTVAQKPLLPCCTARN